MTLTFPSVDNTPWNGYQKPTGDITLPNTVMHNGIQYSVTAIGDNAFYECGLTGSLIIPNSVILIGSNAFTGCGLTSLTIGNSVTTIGSRAFRECYGLTGSLAIPNSVSTIGSGAFQFCHFLGDLIIPNTVTSIGSEAFEDNTGFTGSLIISNSVNEIGYQTFKGCTGFTGDLVIPNSVTSIAEDAFINCRCFTSLTLGSSVITIGDSAFSGCSGFIGNLVIPNSVTSIDKSAFFGCSGFTGNLIIPNFVTYIGKNAFLNCSGFTGSLTIGSSVAGIGKDAFRNCTGLNSVLFNATNCTGMGSSDSPVFYGCTNLTTLIIGDNVTKIPPEAFSGCNNLTGNLIIPNSVTSIGNYAFSSCSNFTSIELSNSIPPTISGYSFNSTLHTIPVHIPCGALAAYQAATGWSNFTNYQEDFDYTLAVSSANTSMGNATITQQPSCGVDAIVTATPNTGYQFVNWKKGNTVVSTDAVYTFTVTEDVTLVANFAKQDFTFLGSETDHNWSTASNWNTGMLPTAADDVVIDGQCNLDQDASVNAITINGGKSLTILSGHKLTATEVVSNNATCLIVNDGGQLFTQTENTVYATVKKGIAAYTGIRDNYYFVAPAAFTASNNRIKTNTTNMLSGEYDLYWFDQFSPIEEWQNYEASPFSYLYMKKGYLYANSANTTLTFAGKLVTTEAEDVGLDYEGEESVFSGFTLIGNPYPCNATVSGKYLVEDAYYVINEASGRENIIVTTNPVVAPCTGLFAVAANEDAVVTFAPTTENATVRGSQNFIRMESFDSQNQLEDRVYVKIGEGNGLQKFNLDAQSTQLYFSRNGKDFAVIPSNGNSEMTVNFTTKDYSRHTISVCPENISCDYLHLIDNLTGSDVDVLSDANSYTFEASPSDYAARFKLVFNVTGVEENAASTSSAYVSNGNLVIDHIEDEAMLQIIDMTGRIVSSETVSGSYNKALNLNAGLYIINLNGSTQKIVVR